MSRKLDFVFSDVFTTKAFGGNQLAVFPYVDDLPTETMQAIARELNLSETTFVFAPKTDKTTFDIRIFTPGTELPFAGHPTIGTALVLDAVGALSSAKQVTIISEDSLDIVLGEGVGPVPVRITRQKSDARAVLTSPRIPEKVADAPSINILAKLLGLTTSDLASDGVSAAAYSAGVPFVFIPVRNREALSRIQFDTAIWGVHLKASKSPHIYAISMADFRAGRQIDARMFAPAMGIPEDPATGAAAVSLAGFLAGCQTLSQGTTAWTIRQGFDMGRPSTIDLEADCSAGAVTAVRVGGSAVLIGRGSIDLP